MVCMPKNVDGIGVADRSCPQAEVVSAKANAIAVRTSIRWLGEVVTLMLTPWGNRVESACQFGRQTAALVSLVCRIRKDHERAHTFPASRANVLSSSPGWSRKIMIDFRPPSTELTGSRGWLEDLLDDALCSLTTRFPGTRVFSQFSHDCTRGSPSLAVREVQWSRETSHQE